MPVKLVYHYGKGDTQLEILTQGPHSAAGFAADAMLGTDDAPEVPWKIEIYPDAEFTNAAFNPPGMEES